jgi:thiamine pyrophosphokinase
MPRIVIFANGIITDTARLRAALRPDDFIICADGGARHAHDMGLIPHIIVGDLDSLEPALISYMEQAGVEIQRYLPHKDQTDLELVLQLAMTKEPREIILMGALGGRLDQLLGNIMLLTRPEYAGIRLTVVEANQTAVLLRNHESLTIHGQRGDTLSLIPLSETVINVTLQGVAWPLTNATLTLGSSWTISNQLTAPSATVQIGEGLLLVVHLTQ